MGMVLGSVNNRKQPTITMPTQVHQDMTSEKPVLPEAPADPMKTTTGSTTDNALMEAERERERQRAALRQQAAQEVFTSGLGAAGMASTSKKTLLGG